MTTALQDTLVRPASVVRSGVSDEGPGFPDGWRRLPARHQPDWADSDELERSLVILRRLPPIVGLHDVLDLEARLGPVVHGERFVLQMGDCVESFADLRPHSVDDRLRFNAELADLLEPLLGVPVVLLPRMGGQFAKPRSSPTERRGSVELPSYKGPAVNGFGFNPIARRAAARRLVGAYYAARRVRARSGRPASPCRPPMAHEGLLLELEAALARRDPETGRWYASSAESLWVGERTRHLDGAHIELVSQVVNPIACKLGPSATPADVLALCRKLNPRRVPGRLSLITRMGAASVNDVLVPILEAVRDEGWPVVWMCDPMHANGRSTGSGVKTRHFDDIADEVRGFVAAHRRAGTVPGGLHLEATHEDVHECVGGEVRPVAEASVDERRRYRTLCDARLNRRQTIDLAIQVARCWTN